MSLLKKFLIGFCIITSSAQAAVTDEERQKSGYFYPAITTEKCKDLSHLLENKQGALIDDFKHNILPYLILTSLEQHPQFGVFQKFVNHQAFLNTKQKFARGASHQLTHFWQDDKTRDGRAIQWRLTYKALETPLIILIN